MNRHLIERLEALSAIPDAEIRSRKSAPGELKQGLNAAITALHAADATRETSPELSSLAASILNMEPAWTWTAEQAGLDSREFVLKEPYDLLLSEAKSLAGSVLSQDQTPGQAEPQAKPDDPQAAHQRSLRDAQQQRQAKPITETVAVTVKGPTGPPTLRDEGDLL